MADTARRTELEDHQGRYVPDALCVDVLATKLRIERDFWQRKEQERGWAEKLIAKFLGDPVAEERAAKVAAIDATLAKPERLIEQLMRGEQTLTYQIRLIPAEQLSEMLKRHGIDTTPLEAYRTVRDLPPCESQAVVTLAMDEIKRRLSEDTPLPACGIEDSRISEELGVLPDVLAELKQSMAGGLCDAPNGNAVAPGLPHLFPQPSQPRSLP